MVIANDVPFPKFAPSTQIGRSATDLGQSSERPSATSERPSATDLGRLHEGRVIGVGTVGVAGKMHSQYTGSATDILCTNSYLILHKGI